MAPAPQASQSLVAILRHLLQTVHTPTTAVALQRASSARLRALAGLAGLHSGYAGVHKGGARCLAAAPQVVGLLPRPLPTALMRRTAPTQPPQQGAMQAAQTALSGGRTGHAWQVVCGRHSLASALQPALAALL